jgi:hypothetical protein
MNYNKHKLLYLKVIKKIYKINKIVNNKYINLMKIKIFRNKNFKMTSYNK